jgi:Ni,Fe-hydrogenase I cytochrome b subunit
MDIEADAIVPAATPAAAAIAARSVYRHRLPVRVMHWINVVCMTILLGSGLNIFNAHPTP